METSVLEELGLTRAEVATYLATLTLGSVSAGKIVEKSKLQNAVVHRAFHSLIEKGLMTYTLNGKQRQYQVVPPEHLQEIIADKERRLQAILPELNMLQSQATHKPIGTTYEGVRGLRELWNLLITDGKELVSYGAPKHAHTLLQEHFWKAHHRKRKEHSIKSRHVFNASFGRRSKQMQTESPTEIRYTEKEFESVTETAVCGNRVGIFLYLEEPVGFLIEDVSAAQSYRRFFEDIWRSAPDDTHGGQ